MTRFVRVGTGRHRSGEVARLERLVACRLAEAAEERAMLCARLAAVEEAAVRRIEELTEELRRYG